MDCEIVKVEDASTVHLLGRIFSAVSTRVRYCFVVAQSGQSGEASLAEMGELHLSANESIDFGHTHLKLLSDNVYDARLVVMWDSGKIERGLPLSHALVH